MTTTSRRAVIITALQIERTAVLEHLQNVGEQPPLRGSIYRRGLFNDRSDPWDIIVAEIGAGNEGAAAEAERVVSHYAPQVALFVGVAGAIKDLKHGDVVASTKVYNYGAGKDRETLFETRPDTELPAYSLLARARHEAGETGWRDRIRAGDKVPQACAPPEAKVGPIAAGPKILASNVTETYKFIRAHYGDAIAVEMEGHGFLLGVRMNHPTQGMVVRGISDRITDKNPANDDDWQRVAARHAAAFAFQILAKLAPEEDGATGQASTGAAPQQVRIGDVAGNCITLNISQHHAPVTQIIGRDSFDGNSEIDLAADQIRQGQPDTAHFQLSSIRKRRWDSLTPREQYRLLANLGRSEESRGNLQAAARHYIEAKPYQPEDEQACSLEAVGYFLLGEHAKARELAAAVLAKHANSSIATSVRIRCAPESTPFATLEQSVPLALREDAAVLHALAWHAAKASDMVTAERLARDGKRSSPDSIEFQEQLGAIIVQVESVVRRNGEAPSATRLEEAVSALSFALSKTTAQKDIARLRYARAAAYDLLDRSDMAETDFRAACENDKDVPEIAFQFAVFLERIDRRDDAIDVLQRISEKGGSPQPSLLLAKLLALRNGAGDNIKAVSILEAAIPATASSDAETRAGLAAMLTRLYGRLGKHGDALRILDSLPPDYLTEAVRLALRADACSQAGRVDNARGLARQAFAALASNSQVEDKLLVARSLYSLGEYRDALSIWKPLLKPTRGELFKEMALESARKSGDDEFIIRYCRQLRSNGVHQPFCLELEAITLERYSCFDEAIALMQEYLRSPSDDNLARWFRVRLSLIGLRQKRADLVEIDPGNLPRPDANPVAVGCATAFALRHGPRPEEGVKYAYELVRQHFSEPEARQVYVAAMGIGDQTVISFPNPTTVGPGCAVRYRLEDSGEEKWVIIEDSVDPKQEREEIAADHVLAQELSGKAVGTTFFYRRDPIQDRTATILAITNKYAYRKLEILASWEDRFPGVMFVRKYTFSKKDGGSPDIAPILRALDQRAEHAEDLHDVYRKHPLSLTTFARISKTSLLESLVHLASDGTLSVRCCLGNNEERVRDEAALREATTLVIDPSALATLFFSDHYEVLGQLPLKLVVCNSSLKEYRDFENKLKTEPSGFFGKVKEQYVFRDDNPEDRKRQQEKVADFLATVQSAATVVSGQRLIEFPPDTRQELIDMFGRPTAEAIAEANQTGSVLWSDDLGVAEVAREKVGARRAWTQLIFEQTEQISRDVYIDVTLFLLRWSFSFTRVEPDAVLAACRLASWDPEAAPLKNVIKWLGAAELNHLGATQVCAKALPMVWQHGPLIHQREIVTQALMQALLERKDGRRTVISIKNNINDIFKLDVANVDLCDQVIDRVLQRENASGLTLPDVSVQ